MSNPAGTPVAPSAPAAPEASVGDIATQEAQSVTSPTEESSDVSEGEVSGEAAPELTKAEQKEIKKWLLKSQGKSREVSDESELVRLAQLGLGAHEKFEQAAQKRKQAEALLDLFQKDPAKALNSMGHDVRKIAEEYLQAEAKKMMMSEEERQKFEINQELDKLKAERDELIKAKHEERVSQLQAKYETDIQSQMIKAIDQYKLPKNPKTIARMAEQMATALENGYELSPLDVAPRVRADLEEEHKSLFSQYNVEDILKLLGQDKMKEIRQFEINKVKAKATPSPTKTETTVKPTADELVEKPRKKLSMDDFREEMDRLMK